MEYMIIQHLSGPMGARLRKNYCKDIFCTVWNVW